MSTGQAIMLSLLAMSAVCAALLLAVRRKESSRIRTLFVAIAATELLLFIATVIEIAVTDLGTKMLLNSAELTAFAALSVLFFLYAVEYTKWRGGVNWRIALAVSALPIAMLGLLYTNDLHHLFFHNVIVIPADGYQEIYQDFATGFFVSYIYCRLLSVVATLFVFRLFATAPRTRKLQVGIVLLASSIPWLITTGDVMFYYSESYVSIVVEFAFLTLTAVLYYAGTFMFRSVDVTPLALDTVVDRMPEGALIIDHDGALAYANSSALAVLSLDHGAIGRKAAEVLPSPLGELTSAREGRPAAPAEVMGRSFEVETTELRGDGKIKGHLMIMRDVTEERSNKEALRLANEKLSLLTSVVRHDLANKLTAANGFIELCKMGNGHSPAQLERMDRLGDLMKDMGAILEFTREYQQLGVESPTWQDAAAVVRGAVGSAYIGPISTVVEIDPVEIYADMMLITAFTNLLDNSVRHGGKVTTIRIASTICPDRSLAITYEDDGVGIPERDKERIFELGYGRNTGLGMFFARQILQITGCSIMEKGVEGKGCRFVITVPRSRWKAPDT